MRFPNFSAAAMKFGEAIEKARKFKVTNIDFQIRKSPNGFGLSVYKGGIYCGPGWGFTSKDLQNKKMIELPEALDAIDIACRVHDQGYTDNGYFSPAVDKKLIEDLRLIVRSSSSTTQHRIDATVISAYFVVQSNITVKFSETKELYQSIYGMFILGHHTMRQVIEHHIIQLKKEK